jgi:hypothetical protein
LSAFSKAGLARMMKHAAREEERSRTAKAFRGPKSFSSDHFFSAREFR